ncbi:hypothetical protein ACOMHN_011642 [Nucella lapillus]
MGQAQTFEELVQICEEYKWCLQKWDVAIASDLDAADYQKDTMACDLYPSDGPDLCPFQIYGDGNCLPRCLSLLACKHEGLHEEMRGSKMQSGWLSILQNEKQLLVHSRNVNNVARIWTAYNVMANQEHSK